MSHQNTDQSLEKSAQDDAQGCDSDRVYSPRLKPYAAIPVPRGMDPRNMIVGQSIERSPETQNAVNELRGSSDVLEQLLSELMDRVQPISAPAVPVEAAKGTVSDYRQYHSSVAISIQDQQARIDDFAKAVRTMLGRLEI